MKGGSSLVDVAEIANDVRQGMVPAHIYNDSNLFERERDTVFARSWVFLAHESEVPNSGDYVVRRILDDSFIVTRDEHGAVRVMFNMCLHRGMQVCRAEVGNASHFRCPYHGWSYKNDGRLIGLPFHKDAYGGEAGFPKKGQALLPAPSMDTYRGLIFISLDEHAPPLHEWLGDFAFYLDFYVNQSPAGIELHGPQRWRIKANWKIGAENFCGDSYHTPQTHTSIVEVGLFGEPKASKRKEGACYFATPGGGTTYKLPSECTFESGMRYVGYPDTVIESAKSTFSHNQRKLISDSGFMPSAATIFPNLSFVHNWPQVDAAGTIRPFISLRQWQPISETETEVLSWFAVDANAPQYYKDESYKAYLMCFGSSGMFEQDDVENWVSITSTAKGTMARRLRLNSRMGLAKDGELISERVADFAGPATAYVGYGEHNQRAWLSIWAAYMEHGHHTSPAASAGNGQDSHASARGERSTRQ